MNCEYVRYACPNAGAIELMGEAYTSNTTMNPSEESLAGLEYFNDIEGAFLELYNTLWLDVKNAK